MSNCEGPWKRDHPLALRSGLARSIDTPRRALPLLLAVLVLAGCRTTQPAAPAEPALTLPYPGGENLHATLWTQTATEYRVLALQTYATATAALDDALADSSWSADVVQLRAGGFEALPPAVVLDVDETVLDNSAYQARLVRDGAAYSSETWKAWVDEAAATAVPGALDFTRAADSLGVAVIYLTNRRDDEEAATRRNLEALGFPIATDYDAVIARGERPEFAPSDKAPRRAVVAERFRIVQQIGDNLGDFLSGVDTTVEARLALVEPYESWWGERWFVLPNPQYGSWESALFDHDYGLTREEQLRSKIEALDTAGR